MPKFPIEDLRAKFSKSTDFNEIFDAFEDALEQRLEDVELYRLLFWNHALTPDELCLFGEKLAREFPNIAYDVYMWLASVFEVTYSSYDNYELCIEYYRKAAHVKPSELDPYLDACDCYEPDLNIPPIDILIEFVKSGLDHARNQKSLYSRLSYLYQLAGDSDLSEYYRQKAEESGPLSGESPEEKKE
jgi:tetratricopeptide (TPR) repeat protein